jgi:mannosyl-oligosaccharide alpha-1,2-mannosidase
MPVRDFDKRASPVEDPLLQDAEPADYDAKPGSNLITVPDPKSDKKADPVSPLSSDRNYDLEDLCEEQGLASTPYSPADKFSLGGMADSTYEYLPKEYMLLGGLNDQYRIMYEKAMETVKTYLLFRPMVPDNRDILMIASAMSTSAPTKKDDLQYKYEGSHLLCFAGGMFAIGSKIFNLKGDLEIGSKLTDGCVWAYESTTTGIMPESFEVLPCADMDNCAWNETRYYDVIDPFQEERKARLEQWYARLAELTNSTEKDEVETSPSNPKPLAELPSANSSALSKLGLDTGHNIPTKQADPKPPIPLPKDINAAALSEELGPKPTLLSHGEYAKARLREERIPTGFTQVSGRKYILRPEAIESVFIMYRITGDDSWRDKGWKMFLAIEENTRTGLANSAIKDVTSEIPYFSDEMESFWLAETLKYFYLLFSDSDLVNLDEYVL